MSVLRHQYDIFHNLLIERYMQGEYYIISLRLSGWKLGLKTFVSYFITLFHKNFLLLLASSDSVPNWFLPFSFHCTFKSFIWLTIFVPVRVHTSTGAFRVFEEFNDETVSRKMFLILRKFYKLVLSFSVGKSHPTSLHMPFSVNLSTRYPASTIQCKLPYYR